MPVTGEEKKINENGIEKDAFILSFTNGAVGQLDELKSFFKKGDKLEIVKMAISFLQLMKEQDEKRKDNNQH